MPADPRPLALVPQARVDDLLQVLLERPPFGAPRPDPVARVDHRAVDHLGRLVRVAPVFDRQEPRALAIGPPLEVGEEAWRQDLTLDLSYQFRGLRRRGLLGHTRSEQSASPAKPAPSAATRPTTLDARTTPGSRVAPHHRRTGASCRSAGTCRTESWCRSRSAGSSPRLARGRAQVVLVEQAGGAAQPEPTSRGSGEAWDRPRSAASCPDGGLATLPHHRGLVTVGMGRGGPAAPADAQARPRAYARTSFHTAALPRARRCVSRVGEAGRSILSSTNSMETRRPAFLGSRGDLPGRGCRDMGARVAVGSTCRPRSRPAKQEFGRT